MTRQQEYEAKLLREARQIKLCRIILFILLVGETSSCRNGASFFRI